MFAVLCMVFALSQFLRNAIGVIAPDLARDLDLTADELGFLSGVFFLSFAAAQIPMGVAIDRYGPRVCITIFLGVAVTGTAAFGVADGFVHAVIARMLMGLGCSCLFMSALVSVGRWFSPERFSQATGILLSLGGIGTLAATIPLAVASARVGWQIVYLSAAAGGVALAALAWLMVRDAPDGHPMLTRKRETMRECLEGVVRAARQKSVAPILVMNFVYYATIISIAGLWGAPYLSEAYGLGLEARGNAMFILLGGLIVGYFVFGPADRFFNSRKIPPMIGAFTMILILLVLGLVPTLSLTATLVLFGVFGLFGANSLSLLTHGKMLFPDDIAGRGVTLVNMAVMSGAFTMQFVTGFVIAWLADAHGFTPVEAYRGCFVFLALVCLCGTAVYAFAQDRPPRQNGGKG
jgi:MFS family permease